MAGLLIIKHNMKKLLLISVISMLLILSCKKNDTGGSATITITSTHHGKKIPLTNVYIKYGAREFPGQDVSSYDAVQTSNLEGKATFEDLRYGDYFFYGVGYDSAIQAPVMGGIGLSIKWKERKNKIELELPITE